MPPVSYTPRSNPATRRTITVEITAREIEELHLLLNRQQARLRRGYSPHAMILSRTAGRILDAWHKGRS